MDISVITYKPQCYAVWFGGSLMASTPEFYSHCHSKGDYMEYALISFRYNHDCRILPSQLPVGLDIFNTVYRKATFELHSPEYLPIFGGIVSVVGIPSIPTTPKS